MKHLLTLMLALSLSLPLSVLAQFEGEIDMKMTYGSQSDQKESLVALFIKKQMLALKMRSELVGERDATIIYREDKKMLWIINAKNKSVFEIPMTKEMAGMGSTALKKGLDKSHKMSISKTGKTETILGYMCDGFFIDTGSDVQEIYGTSKLADLYEGFMKAFSQSSMGGNDWAGADVKDEMAKLKIFPLKTIIRHDGKIISTNEVTKIKDKKIASSFFDFPLGYEKQSLGDIGDMMMKMQKNMMDGMKDGSDTADAKNDMKKMIKRMTEQMKKVGKKQWDENDTTQKSDDDE